MAGNSEGAIVVMGRTGVGKSYLISRISGKEVKIGHTLESCTNQIQVVPFEVKDKQGNPHTIELVDTPGFDDTNLSDADVLSIITNWFISSYKDGIKIKGLLYLHNIKERKMYGSSLKALSTFKKMCGVECYGSIRIITTKWKKIDSKLEAREVELKQNYWKDLLNNGCLYQRYLSDKEMADQILEMVSRDRVLLRIQKEILFDKKILFQTDAGSELLDINRFILNRNTKEVNELRKELDDPETQNDIKLVNYLNKEISRTEETLRTIANNISILPMLVTQVF